MADNTVRDQAMGATEVGKALLRYDFEDMVFGFATGVANSDKRLGNDYIATMNQIIYTQSSISRVMDAISSIPGTGGGLTGLFGGGLAKLGVGLFTAMSGDAGLEVAYINVKVEKPVVDPNGMITKTTIDLNMPRFLVYDKKPLSVKDARIHFFMTIDTVFNKETEQLDSKNTDNKGTWGRTLGFQGAVSRSTSVKTTTTQNVQSHSEVEVEVNFAAADEQPPAHQILTTLFSEIATPISG